MPRAYRPCPNCDELAHARRLQCAKCGHTFEKKPPKPKFVPVVAPQPSISPANDGSYEVVRVLGDDNKLKTTVAQLSEYVGTLEKQLDSMQEDYEKRIAGIELQFKKWYNFQALKIYQRAYEYFGGKGDLYYSKEHGDNPEMFKTHADETGVFIPPTIPDVSHEYPSGEPSDAKKKEVIGVLLENRAPLESDLLTQGVVVEDIMSFTYSNRG